MAFAGRKCWLFVLTTLTSTLLMSVAFDSGKTSYTLREVTKLRPNSFNARWVGGLPFIEYQNLTTGDVMGMGLDCKPEILVEGAVLREYNATSYELSPSREYILIGYDTRQKYYTRLSRYVVYSLKTKTYKHIANRSELPYANWNPSVNYNRILYIHEENIYYVDAGDSGVENAVSRNAVPGRIINGLRINKEPIHHEDQHIGKGSDLYVSPDGTQMSYSTIDYSEVMHFEFALYGEPGDIQERYGSTYRQPFHMAETPWPLIQVWHFNFTDGATRLIAETSPGREHLAGIRWVSNHEIALTYVHRLGNVIYTDLCDLTTRECSNVYEERNTRGWVMEDTPTFSSDGTRFVRPAYQPIASDEYLHVQLFEPKGVRMSLTNGTFMVTEIIAWNEEDGFVFYASSDPNEVSTRHIFAVPDDGNGETVCVTCQMISPEGVPCKSGTVSFYASSSTTKFIGKCTGPMPPFVGLYSFDYKTVTLEMLLDDNEKLHSIVRMKLEPEVVNLKVKVDDGMEADVRLLLPPGADTSGRTKYPMIIYVYGGPNIPVIEENFQINIGSYLTTNRSIIYGLIDGRGIGRKGANMMYAMYKKMGTVEIDDQINVTRYLRDNLEFIDRNRIGIWGWSYGGYATTKVLENDDDRIFKCGIAVAPVSDWIYYNAWYCERFMGVPSSNPEGYRRGSLLYNVEGIRGREYLLVHGTGDNNVHYQHAMHLAKALQRAEILFEHQAYPDEDHGIEHLTPHLYSTMDRFWSRCFQT